MLTGILPAVSPRLKGRGGVQSGGSGGGVRWTKNFAWGGGVMAEILPKGGGVKKFFAAGGLKEKSVLTSNRVLYYLL